MATTLEDFLLQLFGGGGRAGGVAGASDMRPQNIVERPAQPENSSISVAQPRQPVVPPVTPEPRMIPDRPLAGTQYEPAVPDSPVASGGQTGATGSLPPSEAPGRPAPSLSLPDTSPSFTDRLGGVFAGLSGPDALATYNQGVERRRGTDMSRFAANKTFQALTAKGLDADVAAAAVVNPDMLKSILPSLFGGGMTDDVKEYQFNMKQFIARGTSPDKLPDYGTWKSNTTQRAQLQDFEWLDPNDHSKGQRPVMGGKYDNKMDLQREAGRTTVQNLTAGLDRLASTANQLKQAPGLANITGLVGAIPNRPGSQASNAQALLDTLKAKVGFEVLQEMRNASKTGGALGQITEGEHKLLQNALEPLQQAQSYDQFVKALDGILEFVDQSKARVNDAYARSYGEGGAAPMSPRPNASGGVASSVASPAAPDPLGIR